MKKLLVGIGALVAMALPESSLRGGSTSWCAPSVKVTTFDSAPGALVDPNGRMIPTGCGYVSIGTFVNLSDREIMSLNLSEQTDIDRLLDDFLPAGRAETVTDWPGIVNHRTYVAWDERMDCKPIYVVIGNTPEATASDPSTATSWLIYKSELFFKSDDRSGRWNAWIDPIKLINLAKPKFERLLVGDFGEPVYHPDLARSVDCLQLGFERRSKLSPTTKLLLGLTTVTPLCLFFVVLRRKH
ncbi:MAG: hypothetical protein KDN22_31165 [Verrucomicrobiae bacterium]|nr:hypothetical protein [Verrucomicrobiae bacterium]